MYIIWFILILFITVSKCMENDKPDLTLLSKKFSVDKFEYICAAGENVKNSAITFISNNIKEVQMPISIYRSKDGINYESNRDYDCDFESGYCKAFSGTQNVHKIVSTTNSPFQLVAPVIDERWEKFQIFPIFPKMFVNAVLSDSEKSISFSIKSKNGTSLLLYSSSSSDIYWIKISPVISVSKCLDINIDKFIAESEKCLEIKSSDIKVDTRIWQHFTILLEENISLYQFNSFETKLIEFENVLNFKPTFLRFLQDEPRFQDSYLSISKSRDVFKLGPELISYGDNLLCVEFYALICPNCHIEFSLNLAVKKVLQGNPNRKFQSWKYVKLLVQPELKSRYYNLEIKNLQDSTPEFWAIDEVRLCHENEHRIITMQTTNESNVSCQSLKQPLFTSSIKIATNELEGLKICDDNTKIGNDCNIACKAVTGNNYCNEYTICKSNAERKSLCSCALGYQGKYCNEFILPYLKDPPILVQSTISSITIRLSNKIIEDQGQFDVKYYGIEYKEKESKIWISTNKKNLLSNFENITISNLKPVAEYNIRANLYTSDDKFYNTKKIKSTTIKTVCKNVNYDLAENLNYTVSNTNLFIKWKPKCEGNLNFNVNCGEDTWCPQSYINSIYISFGNKTFSNLIPSTKYILIISSINKDGNKILLKDSFKTHPGSYPRLNSLPIIVNITLNSVAIKFSKNQIEGRDPAQFYQLEYKEKQQAEWIPCKNIFNLQNGDNIKNIIYLSTNKTYLVRIVLYTSNYFKDNIHIPFVEFTTNQCRNPSYLIDNLNIIPSETFANISWNPICNNIFKFEISCDKKMDWCEKPGERNLKSVQSTSKGFDLQGLSSFSRYKLMIKNDGKFVNTTYFTTRPSEQQSAVQNLSIYARDDNSISIRWKPPEMNDIISYYQSFYRRCINTNIPIEFLSTAGSEVTCDIWPDYLCYTISVSVLANCYEIFIRAFYEVLEMPGIPKFVQTEPDKSTDPPQNITFNLEISKLCWQHPNFIKGALENFQIDVEQTTTSLIVVNNLESFTFVKFVETRQLDYCSSLNSTLKLSSTYQFRLRTNSYRSSSKNASLIISTEPIVPKLVTDISIGIRTNITQEVTIPQITSNTRTKNSVIYIQICNEDVKENIKQKSKLSNLTNCKGLSWIAAKLIDTEKDHILIIGNLSKIGEDAIVKNKPLDSSSSFSLNVIVINEYKGKEKYKIYSANIKYQETADSWNPLYLLFLLFLLVPIIIFVGYKQGWHEKYAFTGLNRRSDNSNILPLNKLDNNIPENNPLINNQNKEYEDIQKKAIINKETNIFSNNKNSRIIQIDNLSQYVRESLENGELQRQHALFVKGQTKPWDYGMQAENKFKNRYNNLTAYDHSRVVLEKMNGDSFSDFINANYIYGYNQKNAYIATQGPKPNTVNDFWRMIWQENVGYIVMLANLTEGGKKKCEKYWPDIGVTNDYVNISVTFLKNDIFADFEYRTFEVKKGMKKRFVEQLHFTSWPDHGVPLYPPSLVPFLRKILSVSIHKAPIVVHCSAGVGRTGTIILTDICLRMAAAEGQIDVFKYLHIIREQRANMVDNFNQYKLVHMVLLECLLAPETNIPCNKNMSDIIENLIQTNKFQEQIEYLDNTAWHNKAMITTIKINPENECKNRFPLIVPASAQIYISRFPYSDENSDYINAVPVDGFRIKEQFIVTQNPLPNTVKDFWRMVNEYNCKVIVSLNEFEANDDTCDVFWPIDNEEMMPMPHFIIKRQWESTFTYYDVIKFKITNKNAEEGNEISYVKIIQFKNWKRTAHLPNTSQSLISLFEGSQNLSRDGSPMIVTCFDGATACGLFVSLSFVIEKIKLEQLCDVCLATRVVRYNREQFIINWDQFIFLYKSALEYVNNFDEYANFQGPAITTN